MYSVTTTTRIEVCDSLENSEAEHRQHGHSRRIEVLVVLQEDRVNPLLKDGGVLDDISGRSLQVRAAILET
eukprot:372705-Prymnesium_polylepis.1